MATVRTMEDAFRRAIKLYWKDMTPDLETSKDRKYNKKYFEQVGEEMIPKKDQIPEKKKKEKEGY